MSGQQLWAISIPLPDPKGIFGLHSTGILRSIEMTTGYRLIALALALFFLAITSVAWNQEEADLSITKTVDNRVPTVDVTILYTIGLTNHGPDTATASSCDQLDPNPANNIDFVDTHSNSRMHSTDTFAAILADRVKACSLFNHGPLLGRGGRNLAFLHRRRDAPW